MSFHRPLTPSLANARFFETERQLLAPYAMHTENSAGRRYGERDHEYRPAYVRDRDRIIHSAAFRRMAYKTQVFVEQPNDHHRTRLTHTLEVVQIARTASRILKLNEDLTEAVALAHDLGHPPFGHAGERILAELTESVGGFEHNRQGLRLVEQLESRYPNFPGLNLTYEVLESIALHSKRPDSPEVQPYHPNRRMLAECQVVDLADSIAYSTHDIDDAVRHGLLTFEELREVELWRWAEERAKESYGGDLEGKQLTRGVIRSLIDAQVGGMIAESARRLEGVKSTDEVRHASRNLVDLPDEISRLKGQLQAFLFHRVYRHEAVTRRTKDGENKIRRLFEAYLADPLKLPEKYRREGTEPIERRICDYIASMTDRYASKLYDETFG